MPVPFERVPRTLASVPSPKKVIINLFIESQSVTIDFSALILFVGNFSGRDPILLQRQIQSVKSRRLRTINLEHPKLLVLGVHIDWSINRFQ